MRLRWPWAKAEPPFAEGTLARIEAEKSLVEHKAQKVEVEEVASSLRHLRERNHFSEQIQDLIQKEAHR